MCFEEKQGQNKQKTHFLTGKDSWKLRPVTILRGIIAKREGKPLLHKLLSYWSGLVNLLFTIGRPEKRTGQTATTDLYVEHDYDN